MSNRPLDRDNMYFNLNDPTNLIAQDLSELKKGGNSVDAQARADILSANSVIEGLQEDTVKKSQLSFNVLDHGATGTGDDTEAIQGLLDYIETAQPNFPFVGGEVFFPLGVYNVTNLNIKTTISIKGAGYSTVLRVSGSINTPSELSKKLLMSDIRLVGTGSGTLMNINKTWSGSSSATFQLKNIWFHNENGTGLLLDIYGARESGITDCWFTSGVTNNTGTTDAIRFRADSIGGAMNIDVKGCQFHHLRSGILGVGDPNNHQFLAGLRLIDNMFISVYKGIDIQHADYVLIEQSMMDFVDHPVYCNRIANLKIRNSYFAVRGDNNDAVVIENTKTGYIMRWLDIQNNRIFSYATTKGNAIVVHANGGDIAYGNVTNNDIDLVNTSITLKGSLGGRARSLKVNDNRSTDVTTFISLGDSAENNDIEYNYAETSAVNFVVNSNPNSGNTLKKGNKWGTKRSQAKGKIVANGDGTTTAFSMNHNLLAKADHGLYSLGTSAIRSIDCNITYDETKVYFNFVSAPPAGTNNVVINWEVEI